MNIAVSMAKKIKENPFKSLTNIIYELLLEKIVSYDYLPDSKLSIADLSNELSVSKTPIKQAIAMLEEGGFVYTIKNKGTFFSSFDFSDYINFSKFRSALETAAISKAVSNISTPELNQLAIYLNDLFYAYDQINYALIFSSEENFHSFIIRCSRNQYIINAYNDLHIYLKRFRVYVAINRNHYKMTKDYHRYIYEALLIKDQKLCETVMKSHLEIGPKLFLDNYINNNVEMMRMHISKKQNNI
jgi:DNA-binding GntR family transcriptional regulator